MDSNAVTQLTIIDKISKECGITNNGRNQILGLFLC